MFVLFWGSQHLEREKKSVKVFSEVWSVWKAQTHLPAGSRGAPWLFSLRLYSRGVLSECRRLCFLHQNTNDPKSMNEASQLLLGNTDRWKGGRFQGDFCISFNDTCRIMINLFERRHWWCVLKERRNGGLLIHLVTQADRSEQVSELPI